MLRRLAIASWGGLAVLAMIAAGVSVLRLYRLNGPVERVVGHVVVLDVASNARASRGSAWLAMADGRMFRWSCGWTDCRPVVKALEHHARETPMPAELQVVSAEIVGLDVRGVEVIARDRYLGSRNVREIAMALAELGLAAFAAWAAYVRWRGSLPWTHPSRRGLA